MCLPPHSVVITFSLLVISVIVDSVVIRHDTVCEDLTPPVLEKILGPSFNARYMSIEPPYDDEPSTSGHTKNIKRKTIPVPDFYTDGNFNEELGKNPAWEPQSYQLIPQDKFKIRRKRDTNYLQEWHCKSRIIWIDLGPDYFPRYLRSVQCLSEKCWFTMYTCKARSFTVKILRKKKNFCVEIHQERDGIARKELRQLWVWEERAVSFCCDCGKYW